VVEDIVYISLGVLLAGSAATLLITAFTGVVQSLLGGTLGADIIGLLDRLLLILLVVELLYTVQVSFREHAVMPEPFLLVGLIAVIRRILVLTAELGQASAAGKGGTEPLIVELGVQAGLVLALAISLAILRRQGTVPSATRA
jgi:uncharacterized membrane protein (DUF373 family)